MPRRITVPDDHVAIILTEEEANDLIGLLLALRYGAKHLPDKEIKGTFKFGRAEFDVAGDSSLAISTAIMAHIRGEA